LHKYITGIIQNHHHKLIAINGMPDHVHILFGLRPTQALSELMQDIKGSSSKWINEKHFVKGKFSWQEGYGAFSYSKSQLNRVVDYINRQEEHHKQKTFLEEYRDFLNAFRIDYDEKYLFKEIER
jgi:REP element-mobilizing transposase RayT